jgi:hypothetical protein
MRKHNILVIEDTKSIREELRDILLFGFNLKDAGL